jgi:glycerol-3-phosphate O-acyltransferase
MFDRYVSFFLLRGNGFLKPLIILDQSILRGMENAVKIADILAKGENVVLLSNHQTEADPQVRSPYNRNMHKAIGSIVFIIFAYYENFWRVLITYFPT